MIVVEILGGAVVGFVAGLIFGADVNAELKALHEKADAILRAVRGH